MTVILTKSDISFCTEDICTICNKKLWPPFLEWHGLDANIVICGECCVRSKQGLMADLIQVAAIVEINRVQHNSGTTLVRQSVNEAEAKAEAKALAIGGVGVGRFRFKPLPKS